MKKFVIALAIVSLNASLFAGCPCPWQNGSYATAPYAAAPMQTEVSAPAIPVCTTTRQVPYTAYRTEVVHVAPVREVIPQAPIIKAVAQPDLVVRHKQAPIIRPDIICRTPQPCKFVCEERAPLIRYSCPIGTNQGSCPTPCPTPCA